MNYDFDKVIDRTNTNSLKYDFAVERGRPADVLPLWVADMDFPAPQPVLDALQKAVAHGIFGYSEVKTPYYQAVAGWFERHFGWRPEESWLIKTPGVVCALAMAVRAYTKPGDAVLIQSPVYYPFYSVVQDNDRKLVASELLYKDGRYSIDLADFEAKIREHRVKMAILCSPHNPIGRVWTLEELQAIGRICKQYGVFVASDEIHCDFAFEVLYIEPSEVDNDSDLGVFEDHARPFTSGSTLLNAKSGSLDKVLADLRQQYNENEDISFRTEIDRYISRLNDIKKSEGEEDSSEGELSELGVLPDTYLISKPGIISYSMDGYECEMSPYTMKLLDREKAEKIDAEVSDLSRETTRYGEPLFKIIDNSEWYAVMWIDERDLGKYSENKSVSMKLPDGDATGRVYSISESDGEIMVIMRFNAYYDSLSSLRKIQTEVISSDCSGLMIRNSFITSKDGQPGVYVLGVAGDSEFVPIKVKGTDGEYSIVESGSYYLYDEETGESQRYETVGVYDEIEKP